VIETKTTITSPPEIKPSKTVKPEVPSLEEQKIVEKKSSEPKTFISSVVEVIGGDVSPSVVQKQPVGMNILN